MFLLRSRKTDTEFKPCPLEMSAFEITEINVEVLVEIDDEILKKSIVPGVIPSFTHFLPALKI